MLIKNNIIIPTKYFFDDTLSYIIFFQTVGRGPRFKMERVKSVSCVL